MTNEEITLRALEFAKKNKLRIARELTDPSKYKPTDHPVSVFMAGSPGAGKTEFSKYLVKILEGDEEQRVVRIDVDEVRLFMPGYTGGNSHLFHGASSLIVEKMHDMVLHQNQSFIFDGTFSNYDKAVVNISRSLAKTRTVIICYIYQKPEIAWKFTQAREKVEHRNVPKTAFIDQLIGSRETVERVMKDFNDKTQVFIILKDVVDNSVTNMIEVKGGGIKIDDYIVDHYTKEVLERIL